MGPIHVEDLADRYRDLPAADLVRAVIEREFGKRIALVSSFGTEAAVLLHMVAMVDRATPVIFIDTGKLFEETLDYRDRLMERLRLTDVRSVRPSAVEEAGKDPMGLLWASDPDACCGFRKVRPLAQALVGFDAWFTGRKRHHGGLRAALPVFEKSDGRIKVNPLAAWDSRTVDGYLERHGLPRHALVAQGFPSVGCAVCTARPASGEGARSGRWQGSAKTECGIHLPSRS